MQKTLIVLVGLLGMISASSLFRSPLSNFLVGEASNITLNWVNNGYHVAVDYSKKAATNNSFLVALYSSQQVFVKTGTCHKFEGDYTCNAQFDFCSVDTTKPSVAITTPYFVGNGAGIKTQLYASYNVWSLAETAPAVLTTACENDNANVYKEQSVGTKGIFGLGYEADAIKNFQGVPKNFWLSFTNTSALVQFNQMGSPSFSVQRWKVKSSNGNWNVAVEKGVKILDFTSDVASTLLFDINFETNGFPKAMYDGIVAAISKIATCDATVNEHPRCTGKVKVEQLGNLTIQVTPTTVLNLTAYDLIKEFNYLQNEYQGFTLNLKALSKELAGVNHVTEAAHIANTIIIGSRTLKRYTTVFDATDASITAYESTLGEEVLKALGTMLKWIIMAIVGSILVCCLCICFCCGGAACIVSKITGKDSSKDNYYQGSSSNDPFVQNQPIRH